MPHIGGMRQLAAPLVLVLTLSPAWAQDAPAPEAAPDEGFSLMEEGAKLFFRGLMSEMEPAIEEMGRALTELEPMMRELAEVIDDITAYQMPEVLENGDILIRRKPDAPPFQPPVAPPEGEIEL